MTKLLATTQQYFREKGQLYLSHLYLAMFCAAYYGLLRIRELTNGTQPVRAADVEIATNKKKVKFTLHTSKTHWYDVKPQVVKISNHRTTHGNCHLVKESSEPFDCPYHNLRNYTLCRPACININEPFFVFQDRSPVQPLHMRTTLRKLLSICGYDATLFDTHSFRIGRATMLLDMGLSVETIKKLGHWESNCVYTYLH